MPFNIALLSKKLIDQLCGEVTDEFLELLLNGMDMAFFASGSYKKNIKDFNARYVFRTADNTVAVTAIFNDSDMKVWEDAVDDWNARVTFKNARALRDFLFSQDQDILDSVLKNEVEVDGNLNYIYKFGFLARDLKKRLGVL